MHRINIFINECLYRDLEHAMCASTPLSLMHTSVHENMFGNMFENRFENVFENICLKICLITVLKILLGENVWKYV